MPDATSDQAVAGVLLDVDGTLIDSGYQHAIAWWQVLRMHELDVPIATIHRAIGMGGDTLVPHVLRESGYDEGEVNADAADAAHSAIFSTHWAALRRMPGARELVERCHDAGLKVVLASSAGPDELQQLRRVLDADELLDEVTGSDDAQQSKPAPDLVHSGLRKAGLDAGQAVFVGDAVWDVHAAADAGVRCIGLECGGTSAAELREAGALAVYRDPADLVARWRESVLASSEA